MTLSGLRSAIGKLLVDRDGPLTRELLLEPAQFGLGHLPSRHMPDAITKTVCGYCSTGCSLDVHLRAGEAVGISPTLDSTVNRGSACPKGWESLAVLNSPDRATAPLLRDQRGRVRRVSWDTAMKNMVARFRGIQAQHGQEAVAFLGSGQMVTEELALLGALAKFGMGMRHGDGNTRQCMASAAVAYKQSFGFDAPPYTYADFRESDVIVLVGSNLCIAHPIMWEHIVRNTRSPEIIVVDPRRTETAMAATQHLAPVPKSDLSLFYGIARWLIENGRIDEDYIQAHARDFDTFAEFVRPYDVPRVAEETGLQAEEIERFARAIELGKRVSFWWTMGVNQSHQGVRTAQALINLALMTGNLGRAGTGANSITGQCNAMGSRLFSNTTHLLGGRDFKNEDDRKTVARLLEFDAVRIPSDDSWPYHRIFEGILQEKIKGLWVICTNPAHSWINQGQARDILSRLDFLVVQDMYENTQTAQMADLVLPAAGWGEKEGTFINSERRINVVRKVARAPGEALSDFSIFKLVAHYWGCEELFAAWKSPEAVFDILKRLSAGQPCDISGIRDYRMLEQRGGIQWPFPERCCDDDAERRLFADGRFFHADGKARFIFDAPRRLPEARSKKFPFLLLTGRGSAAQWHTQTRTSQSAVLRKLSPQELYVELNPEDARELKVVSGEHVLVESQRGRLTACVFTTPSVQPGQVFVPMHFEETNRLTHASFDPHSSQPSYKSCAVRVLRLDSPR